MSVIYDNWNGSSVDDGALRSESFTLSVATYITQLQTFHYNSGFGSSAGEMVIKGSDNVERVRVASVTTVGGTYHTVVLYHELPAGDYYVTDSGLAWSWNVQGGGVNAGFLQVSGTEVGAHHPTLYTQQMYDIFEMKPGGYYSGSPRGGSYEKSYRR